MTRHPALTWADRHVERRGPAELVKERPWSTVWRLPTAGGGVVYLKACPPATAHEVRLLDALARWGVPHVLTPVALDPDEGWLLLPDGGPTVRDAGRSAGGDDLWPAALAAYGELQRATATHVDALLALGVPDLRPPRLPGVAAALVERWAPRLRPLLARVADESAELDALGPAATLQHDDLHEGNVFVTGTRPFDFGDACVGHPFTSLRVGARQDHLDADRAAHLAGWPGAAPRAVELAVRLAALSRASAWERALAAWPEPPERFRDAPAQWLERLSEDVDEA